jgi:hypothetical protein
VEKAKRSAGSPSEHEGHARAALAPAQELSDCDLEAAALSQLGLARVDAGDVDGVYLALQSMIDHDTRAGLGHYSKSHWLSGYPDGLIDVLIDAFPRAPSPLAHLITARMGGAVERVPVGATAFAQRTAANFLWIINLWEDPGADQDSNHRWVNDVLEATRAYSTGGG